MVRFFENAKPLALLYTSALSEKVNTIKSLYGENECGSNLIPFLEIEIKYPVESASHVYMPGHNFGSLSDQIGTLFFTSGTSGNPKGVVHSYNALLASARERMESWKLTEFDVVLCQKPGNWMGGIFGILPSLMSGACL